MVSALHLHAPVVNQELCQDPFPSIMKKSLVNNA